MRVLLARPYSWISAKGNGLPLSLASLAGVLVQGGHEVRIVDLALVDYSLGKKHYFYNLEEFQPQIVGLTCNSHERFFAFELAAWTKEFRDIPIVAGGPHITFTAGETLKFVPQLDILVAYEGEETLLDICQAMGKGSPLEGIPGIHFRSNGNIHYTAIRPFIKDLNTLPLPARHLFQVKQYDLNLPLPEKPQALHLITSRGCPYSCHFCSATLLAGGKIRYRSVANVIKEIEEIREQFPYFRWVFFYDDHFTLNKSRVIRLCEEFRKKKFGLLWGCYGRLDSLDRPLLEAMKEAGCRMISFGVESGSERTLKIMDKKISRQKIEQTLALVKSVGIMARCSFLFNYPGERLVDAFATINLIKKARLNGEEVVFGWRPILYPGTKLYAELQARGYLPEGFNWCQKFSIPHYKDVPVYTSGWIKTKKILINAYKGIRV